MIRNTPSDIDLGIVITSLYLLICLWTSLITITVQPTEHKASQEGSSLDITCGNQALSTSTDTPIHAQTTFSDTLTNPQTTLVDTTTHSQASLSVTPTRTQTTINDFRTSEQVTLLLSSATPMIDKSLINDKTASDGK